MTNATDTKFTQLVKLIPVQRVHAMAACKTPQEPQLDTSTTYAKCIQI